jgi:UDP-N-acetylglucosamine diphosphorylase/glucosamine-1-phosphate N-acetyltransferase
MNPHTFILFDANGASDVSASAGFSSNLYPFSILHPSFELRCGALRLFEKVQCQFPTSRLIFHTSQLERKPHLASFHARFAGVASDALRQGEDVFILRGNVVPTEQLWRTLGDDIERIYTAHGLEHPLVFTSNGAPFGAFVPKEVLAEKGLPTLDELTAFTSAFYEKAVSIEIADVQHISYLWDALALNAGAIRDDARFFVQNNNSDALSAPGVFAIQPENISVGAGVKIVPCVVLDATKGAIIIGDNVEIQPHVSVVGPCFIGDNVLIKAGTRIYEGTTLGEYSKVAGEIKNTIFQSFGNKQHDGCLGYSFIGEWVNLGAGTDVSDLKNNYGTIRVRFSPDKAQEISTGVTSLGLLAGDHTKSAINTSFNTGTVTGISANVFETSPDKFVPSFSWGGRADSPTFELDKAVELARTVMSRRNRQLTGEEETLLRMEFQAR